MSDGEERAVLFFTPLYQDMCGGTPQWAERAALWDAGSRDARVHARVRVQVCGCFRGETI